MEPPDSFDPPIGHALEIAPGLRRIVAPNPSPMTYRGTNTYLLGHRHVAVIDPGPLSDAHLAAILRALDGQTVSHIIVTHAHLDHAPLARPLAQATGAPVLAFGTAEAGRSAVMQTLLAQGVAAGGEGVDTQFAPDQVLADGQLVDGGDWQLEVIHTPGHMGNHICLAWQDHCFTADHVMGWASSLVSPPDGDLTDFMASCRKLAARSWRVFHPGHGDLIGQPAERLNWLITHRQGREAAILHALTKGPADATAIAKAVYHDTPPALLPAAARNVLAHLIDLHQRGQIRCPGALSAGAQFASMTSGGAPET